MRLLNNAGVKRELLDTVKARKLAYYGHTMRKQESCLEKEICKEQCQVHAGDEDHARPGWTTSIRGQNARGRVNQKDKRTEINGESTSIWCGQPSDRGRLKNRTISTHKAVSSVSHRMTNYCHCV